MKVIIGLLFLLVSFNTFSAIAVGPTSIQYVYQLDSEETVFEFATGTQNSCNSYHYRVKSPNEAVANRKFSLILAAFSSGKKVMFADMQVCEGDRAIVSWVRLVH